MTGSKIKLHIFYESSVSRMCPCCGDKSSQQLWTRIQWSDTRNNQKQIPGFVQVPLQQGWPPLMTDCCELERWTHSHCAFIAPDGKLGGKHSVTTSGWTVPSTKICRAIGCWDKWVIITIKTAASESTSGQWNTRVESSVRHWGFGEKEEQKSVHS